MSGDPRLIRESPGYLDPQATCGLEVWGEDGKSAICGGRLRVQDWHPDGIRGTWRYEVFCTSCKRCDPNGYATQAEVMTVGMEFFQAKVKVTT